MLSVSFVYHYLAFCILLHTTYRDVNDNLPTE